MKNIILTLLISFGILFSCCKNNDPVIPCSSKNEVALLKVDYLTNTFEGGKELIFSANPDFTISSTYQPPLDFGAVQLFYEELNELIFNGTIVWMGLGTRSYPATLDSESDFTTINTITQKPNDSLFKNVMYDNYAFYPDTINYSDIWNSINNLELVSNYMNSNPGGKVNLFLYTPSVGYGNPVDWDWYIILKN